MDEFSKTKVSFTIALLATVFALKPIIETYKGIGYFFFEWEITIQDAYFLMLGILAVATYLMAMQLATRNTIQYLKPASDLAYGLSLSIPAGFIVLGLLVALTNWLSNIVVVVPQYVWSGLTGLVTGLITSKITARISNSIRIKEAKEQEDEIKIKEVKHLQRAEYLYENELYDLSLLESAKIIEYALRQAVVLRTGESLLFSMHNLVNRAANLGMITAKESEEIDQIRLLRNNTAHTNAIVNKEQADHAIQIAKNLVKALSYKEELSSYEWLIVHKKDALKSIEGLNEPLLETTRKHLQEAWNKRDGSILFDIADFFEFALLKNPSFIFEVFKEDHIQYREWLNDIREQIFWDHTGDNLEEKIKLKEKVLTSLLDYRKRGISSVKKMMLNELIQAVKDVEPYSVN